MSISGLHITMFAWAAAAAVGWLWRRSARLCLRWPATNAALVGGVLLALLYALFSGFGVPAQRTVLMLATVTVLRLSGARWPWPQTWLLACAVVVAFDPWALLQAGFWLSFVAVGVLFASNSGAVSSIGKKAKGQFHSIWREQWIITLALAPLSLVLFGQVSLVGLAANALAIPWVTLLVTPLAMLGVFVPALWDVAAWAALLMMDVLRWLAAWPGSVMSVAQAPWWVAAAAVLGGVILVLRLPWSLRALGLPLLLPVVLWQAPLPPTGQFELLAADIGQGSAVLVRTSTHALMFDAGPRYNQDSDAGQRVLVPLLRALGVRLDVLLLSHRDNDHMGGAAALLADQPQAGLISSFDAASLTSLAAPAARRCVAGQRWRWDGVDFELLHPLAADYAQEKKTNPMSCVLRISNGQQVALLTGDIEQAQETDLLNRLAVQQPVGNSSAQAGAPGLRTDVLLVPHHGSQTSSSARFLDAAKPRIAVVQAGYRNRFGHPAIPVLVRYAERQVQLLDTPHCGAVTWQSWQPNTPQCQRKTRRHYWQHQF
jgi:competence protein ComEC